MTVKSGLIVLCLTSLLLAGCGKKGDPVAPTHGSVEVEKSIA